MEAPPHYVGEKPPSYDSLFVQLKAARSTSDNNLQFVMRSWAIITGSIVGLVFLIFSLAIPLSAIVMGSLYLNDCPAERYIAIFLVVYGCFTLVKDFLSIAYNVKRRREKRDTEEEDTIPRPTTIDTILSCFLLAWFIAGNVWIYRLNGHWSSSSMATNYCNPTLYYYAFWMITAHYILLGGCCVASCVTLVVGCLLCRGTEEDSATEISIH